MQRPSLFALKLGCLGGRVPDIDALADLRRRVWHHPNDGRLVEAFSQSLRRRPGDDGNQQLVGTELPAELVQHSGHHLWLDAEHDDVSLCGSLGIVGGHLDAVFLR